MFQERNPSDDEYQEGKVMRRAGKGQQQRKKAHRSNSGELITLTKAELKEILDEHADKLLGERLHAAEDKVMWKVINRLAAIPTCAICSHMSDFWQKERDGENREQRMFRTIVEWFYCVQEHYITYEELENELRSKGVDIERVVAEVKRQGKNNYQ